MVIKIIVKNDKAIPVVKATNKGVIGYITCPYCDKKHTHGNTKDISHRVTHCAVEYQDKFERYAINKDGTDGFMLERDNGYYIDFT